MEIFSNTCTANILFYGINPVSYNTLIHFVLSDNTVLRLLFLFTQEEVLKHMKFLFYCYTLSGRLKLSTVYTLHNNLPGHVAHSRIDLVKDKITKQ